MAKLYFRYGAMNCGKTTALLQVAHNYEERGMNILLLKPSKDKKGEKEVVSRLGVSREVDYLVGEDDSIIEIAEEYLEKNNQLDCLLVDETQFLEPKQVDELLFFATEMDIPVICYGLRTDFKLQGFPGASRLLEIASTIEEMKTICECGKKATLNARFVDGELTIEGEQVAIDGFDNVTYRSMCPKCYFKKVKKLTK
ncbi:MAG: thymidine kinase [Bacilli bacterium]|nr:thymidine kinase [Bacilli bacterium]